jgi:hypothetical protein
MGKLVFQVKKEEANIGGKFIIQAMLLGKNIPRVSIWEVSIQ